MLQWGNKLRFLEIFIFYHIYQKCLVSETEGALSIPEKKDLVQDNLTLDVGCNSFIVQRSEILSNEDSELSLTAGNENGCFSKTDHSGNTVIRKDSTQLMDSLEQDQLPQSKTNSVNSVISNRLSDVSIKAGTNGIGGNETTVDKNKFIVDKCTQISTDLIDKDCNTSHSLLLLKEIPDDAYVLINKPVYILRSILESDEKYILLKESMSEIQLQEHKQEYEKGESNANMKELANSEEKECDINEKAQSEKSVDRSNKSSAFEHPGKNEKYDLSASQDLETGLNLKEIEASDNTLNLSDYSMKSLSELDMYYMTKMNYSKLLTSDYDLTPQRDWPSTTDKYHHLLVDAMTSISHINIGNKNLLLTEDYALPSLETDQNLKQTADETNQPMMNEEEIEVAPEKPAVEIDKYVLTVNDTEDSVEIDQLANRNMLKNTANKYNTGYELLPLLSRSATFLVENTNELRHSKNVSFNVDIPSSDEFSSISNIAADKDNRISEHCQTDLTQIDVSTSMSGFS